MKAARPPGADRVELMVVADEYRNGPDGFDAAGPTARLRQALETARLSALQQTVIGRDWKEE
jgi:L-alanine-DL-glutamate epimerase-like enolase superfamily enzyme